MQVIVYGALAKPITAYQNGLIKTAKRNTFEIRDILLFKFNNTSLLDYRNYDNEYSTNKGDMAIAQATSELLQSLDNNICFNFYNWGRLPIDEIQNKINNKFIVAGGGYFFLQADGRIPSRLKEDLNFFKANRVNPILFGVGLNAPGQDGIEARQLKLDPSDENTIREILNQSNLISVRDDATKNFLQTYTEKPISLIGDPAIFLGRPQHQYCASKIQSPCHPIIGINFPFHGPTSNKILKSNITKYVEMLEALQEKTNCDFKYFLHYDAEYIVPKLLKSKNLEIQTIYGTPSQLISEYRTIDLHIGGMLHSCIMAHSVGTPCISLAYDIKHLGFFQLMGTEENYFSALNFDPKEIVQRSLLLLEEQEEVRKKIHKRVNIYNDKIIEFSKQCISNFNSFSA